MVEVKSKDIVQKPRGYICTSEIPLLLWFYMVSSTKFLQLRKLGVELTIVNNKGEISVVTESFQFDINKSPYS